MLKVMQNILYVILVIVVSSETLKAETLWNFAYGANMDRSTLKSRKVTPIQAVPAKIKDWTLRFNLIGIPWFEPAFGNVEYQTGAVVHGVAYELTPEDFKRLREIEGGGGYEGEGYDVIDLTVETYNHKKISAKVFTAVSKWKHESLPSQRYLNLLIRGATENHLNESYIRTVLAKQNAFQGNWAQKGVLCLFVAPIYVPAWLAQKVCHQFGWSTLWYQRFLLDLAKFLWSIHGDVGKA